jgi:cytochrome c553
VRSAFSVLLAVTVLAAASLSAQNPTPTTIPNGLPTWAYNLPDKVQPPEPQLPSKVRAPGSSKEYDATAIAGNANPPDWFPDEHPAAPRSVKGPMPNACGSCHLMSGQGHPEAADIAGMPADYIIRQMQYFKAGTRKEEGRMGPIARAVSDQDVREAADYFAALTPAPFVKVIESATPPKTYVSADARHRRIHPDGGSEPIGRRIIQIPADPMRTTMRDPHSGFIAYVPPGSIARGAALAGSGGGGRTIQCTICHGDTLTGLGDVPRIAGLQPVYIARQLITMQNGTSAGSNAALMKKVVARLSEDDIISLSAYLGSLPPR